MTISAVSGTWAVGTGWPWPQVIFTDNFVLGVALDNNDLSLYELVNTNNNWTATKVARLGYAARITSVDVADFITFYVITVSGLYNNLPWKATFGRVPNADTRMGAVSIFSSELMPFGTSCCNFKGQLVIGGCYSGNIKWQNLGSCSVAWSGIGGIEFDPALDASSGFMHMPWDSYGKGEVYKVKRLGDLVYVYGDQGIASIKPFYNEPVAGFGLDKTYNPGILSSNAIAGNEHIHCFVDTNYDLNLVTAEGIKNIGYRAFMSTLTASRIMVSYDAANKRFHISNDTLSFVLSEGGLYSTHQCVTSIGTFRNRICGFVKDNGDTKIRIETSAFDAGVQALKTIESFEFGLDYDTTTDIELSAGISTKYDYRADYTVLPLIRLNNLGGLTQKTTGRLFKLRMEGNYQAGATFVLSSLLAKIKFSDKNSIRGRVDVS